MSNSLFHNNQANIDRIASLMRLVERELDFAQGQRFKQMLDE
jgi:hypothetical protein